MSKVLGNLQNLNTRERDGGSENERTKSMVNELNPGLVFFSLAQAADITLRTFVDERAIRSTKSLSDR